MTAIMTQPTQPQGQPTQPPSPPPIPVMLDNETRDTLKLARLTMRALWVFMILVFVAWLFMFYYERAHRFAPLH
jgi:hypothetical protein